MRWLWPFVWVFAGGSLAFLMYADFYLYHTNDKPDPLRNVWDDAYYVWDTGKDLLIMLFIYSVLDETKKWIIKPLFLFASIRLLWAITVPFTNLDKVANPLMVTMAFTLLIIGVITYSIRDLKIQKRKEL